jgi:hypothetical protein
MAAAGLNSYLDRRVPIPELCLARHTRDAAFLVISHKLAGFTIWHQRFSRWHIDCDLI